MAYFTSIPERQAWVMSSVANALTFGIFFNPRGAYDIIQRLWPGEFPRIEQGNESSDYWKNRMHDFLEDKSKREANPMQFAINFLNTVPAIVTATFNSHDTFLIK